MGLAQDQLQQQMMDSSDPNISPIQAPPIPAPWVSGHTDPRAIPAGHAGSWSNLPAPSDYNYTTRAGDTPLNHQAAQELKSKAQIDAWLAEEAKRREKK
jgi:hypothetical protein